MRIVWYGTSPDCKKYGSMIKTSCHSESGCANVFGFYILMSSPGAGPWDPTPGHCRRRQWAPLEEEPFPFWTARPPSVRRPSSSFFPLQGIHLPPPPRPLRRWNGHQSLRILCSKFRGDEGHPGSFWPPSRPSSSAPCKALGPASSSEVGWPVLRAARPDNGSAPPSSSSPGRVI